MDWKDQRKVGVFESYTMHVYSFRAAPVEAYFFSQTLRLVSGSFHCFFADMRMSTSMYEIFNWTEGAGTTTTPISNSPAQVTRSNSSYFGIFIFTASATTY